MGFNSFATLRDLKNAFCCTSYETRCQAIDMHILKAEVHWCNGKYQTAGADHNLLFKERIKNTVIEMDDHDNKKIQIIPQTCNIIGTSEGTLLFIVAFNPCIELWQNHGFEDNITENTTSAAHRSTSSGLTTAGTMVESAPSPTTSSPEEYYWEMNPRSSQWK